MTKRRRVQLVDRDGQLKGWVELDGHGHLPDTLQLVEGGSPYESYELVAETFVPVYRRCAPGETEHR
jgi:hypothetical protein